MKGIFFTFKSKATNHNQADNCFLFAVIWDRIKFIASHGLFPDRDLQPTDSASGAGKSCKMLISLVFCKIIGHSPAVWLVRA